MDRERLPTLSRLRYGSIQRVFPALVWNSQGSPGRLLGHPLAPHPQHLAQLLYPRPERCVGRFPHLRKIRTMKPSLAASSKRSIRLSCFNDSNDLNDWNYAPGPKTRPDGSLLTEEACGFN